MTSTSADILEKSIEKNKKDKGLQEDKVVNIQPTKTGISLTRTVKA